MDPSRAISVGSTSHTHVGSDVSGVDSDETCIGNTTNSQRGPTSDVNSETDDPEAGDVGVLNVETPIAVLKQQMIDMLNNAAPVGEPKQKNSTNVSISLSDDKATTSANDDKSILSGDHESTSLKNNMGMDTQESYKGPAFKMNGTWEWENCYENDQKIAQYLGFDQWQEWQKFRFSTVCIKYIRFKKDLPYIPNASQLEYILDELTACVCSRACNQAPCVSRADAMPARFDTKTWEHALVQFNASVYRFGEQKHHWDLLAATLLVLFKNDLLSPIQVDEADQAIQDELIAWRHMFEAETAEYGDGGRSIPDSIPREYHIRPSLGLHLRHGETCAEPYNRLWQLLLNIHKDVISKEKWYRNVHGVLDPSLKPNHMKTSVFVQENEHFAKHGYYG